MRPEWQECFLTPGEGSSGGIRNGPHAVKLAGLAFREFRGGQTVAKAASIFMRSKWQECPFVSPEEGRRWPNRNGPHAAKVAGVAFCDPRGGQMVAEAAMVPRGQSGRVLTCCESEDVAHWPNHQRRACAEWTFRRHMGGQTAEPGTARMRPEWQEWHFVSLGEGRRCPNPERSECGQSGVTAVSRGHGGGQTVAESQRSACGQGGRGGIL
jgi:hypothetical protein